MQGEHVHPQRACPVASVRSNNSDRICSGPEWAQQLAWGTASWMAVGR